MARSPIFLFAVLVTVAVALVMGIGMMKSNSPVNGTYSDAGSPANLTSGMISQSLDVMPNWVLPAILLGMALVIIGAVVLFKRR